MNHDTLAQLYTAYTGRTPESITALPASGSNRRYFRLTGSPMLIGVEGESVEENRAFLYLAGYFHQKGLPVPEVVAHSADDRCYLQEDLGDTSLFDAIAQGRASGTFSPEEKALLHRSIALLPRLQVEGAQGLDFARCHPQPAFNERSVLWDLNYFKYCFLKAVGVDFQENRLEDDFQRMAQLLTDETDDTFLYRDFQSRNVMLRDGQPWFIDFQGGRRGPVYYDVASFLWQAKANYPDDLRHELLTTYIEHLRRYRPVDEAIFHHRLRHFVLFRLLQVLGAYGFRGYFERKPHFLQSIPPASENLRRILQQPFTDYPHLSEVLHRLTDKLQQTALPHPADDKRLTVTVCSFSYRKGLPEDTSGNGGGFVFDCRSVHNPGKYEAYKPLTGLDAPVIRFLEEDGEMTTFMQHAYALTDATVRRYLERGFTHLSVSFGCTGGRHRSVYGAQHMAEHLNQTFGIRVVIIHREQGIRQTLEGKTL